MSGWGDDTEAGWGAPAGGGGGGARNGGARSGGAGSYQRGGGVGSDDDYLAVCNQIRRDLNNLKTHTASIQAAIKVMGTRRDTRETRERLKRDINGGTRLTKSVAQMLKSDFRRFLLDVDSREKSKRKKQRDKYLKDLNALGHSFQTVMTEALELEQQHVVTARNSVDVSHGGGGGGGDQNEYNAALLEHQQQQQQLEFNEAIIAEREAGIVDIQQDVQQVNEIFRDLAHLVDEQGDALDTMDWNIQEAHQRTERGVKHLVTATKHQKKYRKSLCCFLGVLVVVAGGVALYLYLSHRK